jgi:hypothetical protein
MRAISAARSRTSVAVIRGPFTWPSWSTNSALRIRSRSWPRTSSETSNRPGVSSGVRPADPTAFGIIVPGTSLMVAGLMTPSSSACQMPVTAIEAFLRTS